MLSLKKGPSLFAGFDVMLFLLRLCPNLRGDGYFTRLATATRNLAKIARGRN